MSIWVSIVVEWWYGPVVCKVAPYIQGVAVGTSVNTLAAVAIERYMYAPAPAGW